MSSGKQTSSARPDAKFTSTQIIERMVAHEEKTEENHKAIMALLSELITKVDAARMAPAPDRPRTRSTTKSAAVTTPVEKKPPSNSMLWFKREWATNKEKTIKRFCTEAMMTALEEHMKTDKDDKDKEGTALLEAEHKFIWSNFIRPNHCKALKETVKLAFEKEIDKINVSSMTPAKKDSE